VDKFSDEVASRKGLAVPLSSGEYDKGSEDSSGEVQRAECNSNFRAVALDESKKMWGVFEECGFFVSACWHLLILWFSDMIHSGEL